MKKKIGKGILSRVNRGRGESERSPIRISCAAFDDRIIYFSQCLKFEAILIAKNKTIRGNRQ